MNHWSCFFRSFLHFNPLLLNFCFVLSVSWVLCHEQARIKVEIRRGEINEKTRSAWGRMNIHNQLRFIETVKRCATLRPIIFQIVFFLSTAQMYTNTIYTLHVLTAFGFISIVFEICFVLFQFIYLIMRIGKSNFRRNDTKHLQSSFDSCFCVENTLQFHCDKGFARKKTLLLINQNQIIMPLSDLFTRKCDEKRI